MKVIGFNFTKNDFRFAVLEDSSDPPVILDKNKIILPNHEVDELMAWFETQIGLIINNHNPDIISHKVSNAISSIDQVRHSCYPQGILNLIARQNRITINSFTPQGINSTKFGQPKKTDVYKHIDPIIGKHPPYWDKATKDAVLVAWFNLLP